MVKHRFDQDRCDEDHEYNDGDGDEPEFKPPAVRTLPQAPVSDADEQRAKTYQQREGLEPVEEPRSPFLDREAVSKRETVAIHLDRQLENEQEQKSEAN